MYFKDQKKSGIETSFFHKHSKLNTLVQYKFHIFFERADFNRCLGTYTMKR